MILFGYPGNGKSTFAGKLTEAFMKDGNTAPFSVIDKDMHRDLFPNLFQHLKDGHLDECEKFAGVAVKYVRTVLDTALHKGDRSVLSVGALGAAADFKKNAEIALSNGITPTAVYMAVNPDVAYLSSLYRTANLYEDIILKGKEDYPRLVSLEFLEKAKKEMPEHLKAINEFQKENADKVRFMVVDRSGQTLYDSKNPEDKGKNPLDIIKREKNRPLTDKEAEVIKQQVDKIAKSVMYRVENNVYSPYRNEVQITESAMKNVVKLMQTQPVDVNAKFEAKILLDNQGRQ